MRKQKVIIIIGPPGSGKGTQSNLLSEKLNLYYLETARVGEEKIEEAKKGSYVKVGAKRYYFEAEKRKWEKGELWSPPFVSYLVKQKIKQLSERKRGIVFAGSPRTLKEAKELMPYISKLYGKSNIKVIELKLSVKESVFRNSHRKICQLMRHPILYNKETKNLKFCPLDGSKLEKRALDKPEIIRKRYKVYQEQTFPLIDYFKKEKFKVFKVNGEQSVANVFSDILKKVK